jgi:hypothetical protein
LPNYIKIGGYIKTTMLNKIIKSLVLIFSFYLLTSFVDGLAKKSTSQKPIISVKGDFNGDGKIDSMWLIPPKITTIEQDCKGDCNSFIKFSDQNIPSIKVENCIGGMPTNLGDLNQNGTDEIGLLPEWFSSYWSAYYVWTYINGKWVQAVPPFTTHTNQWDAGVKPIEVDKNKPGYVIIRYSEFSGEEIVTKSKSLKIKR